MNRIGKINFWSNLTALQDIEDCDEKIPIMTKIVKPVSRTKKWLIKLIENWVLFVGIVFLFFTIKIAAESIVGFLK